MGFTLAPRDFNDAYNEHIEQWEEGGHEHGHHELLETKHPLTDEYYNFSLNTFMDDVTKIHVITAGSSAEYITTFLNESTARLENTIAKGG
eukprot:602739-Pyramimonas_sp.AAC.1